MFIQSNIYQQYLSNIFSLQRANVITRWLIGILFLDIETCPGMVCIRNFSQQLLRIVNTSMWFMPLCVQSDVSWDIFYIYIGCFVFWVGLLFLPPLLIRFPSKSWHLTMLQSQFLCESTVKHTGGFTINPNLGLWLQIFYFKVYVNSCICLYILCTYSEGLFQREKEGGQNLLPESWKMGLFINDIIRIIFSLG